MKPGAQAADSPGPGLGSGTARPQSAAWLPDPSPQHSPQPLPHRAPQHAPAQSPVAPTIRLHKVASAASLSLLRELLSEYATDVAVDLSFQNFDQELAQLPGDYAPPQGALLLALVDGWPAGCVAMRALPECDHTNACEMKRLYVRRPFRRLGLGRMLARRMMELASLAGYSCMLLDTLDDMESARTLYATLGFVEVAPYYYNPIAGAHYLKALLDPAGAPGDDW